MDVILFAAITHAASSHLLFWIGQAILYGTVLAGLTALVVRLSRHRVSPAVETCLWAIVLVKFLIPTGPAWAYSLSSLYRQFSYTSTGESAPNTSAGIEVSQSHTSPAPFGLQNVSETDFADNGSYGLSPHPVIKPPLDAPEPVSAHWHWRTTLCGVYLLCVLGLFVRRIQGYRRLVARCHALPLADESTRDLVTNACRRLDIRRVPSIRVSPEAPTPFVMGCLRVQLVLSRNLLVRPDELEAVILHEIAHLRRSDMLVRYLQWVAGTLLFFWPVVAWVNRRLDAARESACDTWALRHGKLSVHEYARCLLRAVKPVRPSPFAYSPCNMATQLKSIERRIDMILESPTASSRRRTWGLSTLVLLLVWGSFTLTGANTGPMRTSKAKWLATEESVHERAAEVYALVAEHSAADINGDGVTSYLEKDTYLVALAMRNAEAFMEEFPYADRNHSGHLDILEANGVVRAITLIAYADRRASATTEHSLPLEFCHAALDAQIWLLDNQDQAPSAAESDQIWSILCRVRGSANSYSARMFDHGGPSPSETPVKFNPDQRSQFQELENNIAAIKARMAASQDSDEMNRLQTMLSKLETFLDKLQTS